MRFRRIAIAATAPLAACALIPGDENSPSGLSVLSLLPAGLAGALLSSGRRRPRQPMCEVVVQSAGLPTIRLCGVCHVEPASALAVHDTILRHANAAGGVAAVALECDARTLELVRTARQALHGLSAERVRSEGVGLLREALFASPTVHEMAHAAGARLHSASQVGLPAPLSHHLERDGVVWSEEMATAATAATSVGARIVCLGEAPTADGPPTSDSTDAPQRGQPLTDDQRHPAPSRAPSRLGMLGCWLRAYALEPGLDERSCDLEGVAAANEAMRQMLPAEYRRHVTQRDDQMAARLRRLRDELAHVPLPEPSVSALSARTPRACIVVVVGARHVPGLQRRLLDGVE